MKRNILFKRGLVLALFSLSFAPQAPAADAGAERLPLTVFSNLHAGKQQTVVVYGTSLTAKGAWAGSLQEYFEKYFPGKVTFVNGAKPGMASDWGVQNLQERVLSKNPDLVFIEFSMNDAALSRKVSLEQSEANLDTIVKAIRAQNPRADIVLQTMNVAWDSPKTAEKKYGSDRPNLNDYYEIYRRYASTHNLPLVDNYQNWLKLQKDDPERYQKAVSDGIHPHSAPSREITWPAVQALLEKARTASSGH